MCSMASPGTCLKSFSKPSIVSRVIDSNSFDSIDPSIFHIKSRRAGITFRD